MTCADSIKSFPWIFGQFILWTTSMVHDKNFCVNIYLANFVYCVVTPTIEVSVSNQIRNQEENILFFCQAVGEPVPDISWFFNDIMINVSDNSSKYITMSRSLNITTTENTLTVYNVTSADVGTYTCNASTIIGSISDSGILTVTSKSDN